MEGGREGEREGGWEEEGSKKEERGYPEGKAEGGTRKWST